MPNNNKPINLLRKKWLLLGGFGALLLGAGLSGTVESGLLKYGGAPWWQWALTGTFSLALVITGVILLIKSAFVEQELKQ